MSRRRDGPRRVSWTAELRSRTNAWLGVSTALGVDATLGPVSASQRAHGAQELRQSLLVTPVERPLLDPLPPHQSGAHQHAHVLAHRRLAQSQLLGDQEAADTVRLEIPVHLWPEVPRGLLQPAENLETPVVVQRAERIEEPGVGIRVASRILPSRRPAHLRGSATVISISTAAPIGSARTATVVRAGKGCRK